MSVLKPISRTLLAVSLGAMSTPSIAVSFTDSIDGRFDMGEYLAENAYGFLPIPILITEPALGYGAGMVGMFLHESEEQTEKRRQLALTSIDGGAQLIPPAVTVLGGGATQNGTWFGFFGHRHIWKEDSIRYLGGIGYGNVVLELYFGSDNQFSAETETVGLGGVQKLQFRLADSDLFLGVQQFFSNAEFGLGSNGTGIPDLGFTKEFTTSALGFNVEYDNKDNFFFPRQGYYTNLEYLWFDESIGSNYDFETLLAQGQAYFPLSNSFTFVAAAEYNVLSSDSRLLPRTLKPYADLRGLPSFKYQGNYTGTAEAQVMWHIDPRWTALLFGGVGVYSDSASDFWNNPTPAIGTGFRYLMARRYGIQAGVDIAVSEDDSAFYITVGTGI